MRFLFFILVLVVFFTVSCGDSPRSSRRKTYDLSASNALLEVGDALTAEDANWDTLSKSGLLDERLAGILRDEASRRELFTAANDLLQEERFHDLASLIDDAEDRGEASPALLELRNLPQALQALSLFCARRPYQKSKDLEQAMNFLSPWVPELSRLSSEAFPPFWASQEALLGELRLSEKRQRIGEALSELDRALTTRGGKANSPMWTLAEIAQVDENAEILQYVSVDCSALVGLAEGIDNPAAWTASRELAMMLCWETLSEETRSAAAEVLASRIVETLSGQVLKARSTASPEEFLMAIRRWQEMTPPAELQNASPAFFGDYLWLLTDGVQVRKNPVPGIAEIMSDFLQLIP